MKIHQCYILQITLLCHPISHYLSRKSLRICECNGYLGNQYKSKSTVKLEIWINVGLVSQILVSLN